MFYLQKKIKGFVIIKCDCGNIVCMNHINKHSHNCNTLETNKIVKKNKIKKENPIIDFKKIDKI